MRNADQKALTDIHIVHTDSEWQIAQTIARLLDARGYSVAPSRTLDLPNHPSMDTMPNDAAAVLVIWPMTRALFDKPALEARAAAQSGRLIQIYAGAARPDETYAGPSPVDFSDWDLMPAGEAWSALMRRVRRLCGAPPKLQVNMGAVSQAVALYTTLVLAVGGIGYALVQSGANNDTQEAAATPPRPIEAPDATPIRRAIVMPTQVAADEDAEARDAGLGGPEDYEKDLGVEEVVASPVITPPAPATPQKRAPQNPPSALD